MIKQTVFYFFVFLSLSIGYYFVEYIPDPGKVTRWGVVLQQTTTSVESDKYSRGIRRYLTVKFDDGIYEDVYVNANTYFNSRIGKRIGFTSKNPPTLGYLAGGFFMGLSLAWAGYVFVTLLSVSIMILFRRATWEEAFISFYHIPTIL